VNAVRADAQRQIRVGGDQELKPSPTADLRQPPRGSPAIRGPEMAIHNCGSSREPARNCRRVGRPDRIGEKEQRRNSGGAGVAVEPARLCG
jgi:hypothetical protein